MVADESIFQRDENDVISFAHITYYFTFLIDAHSMAISKSAFKKLITYMFIVFFTILKRISRSYTFINIRNKYNNMKIKFLYPNLKYVFQNLNY